MKIKILSLYPDLMNLYGNSGNLRCLTKHIQHNGIEVEINEYSIGDELTLSDADFVYMGAGTERSQKRALCDLKQNEQKLKEYYQNGGLCLFCGNSFELLGRKITDINGEEFEGLNLFAYESFENKRRVVVDTVCSCRFTEQKIIGFMNKQSTTTIVPNPLFRVLYGRGNAADRNDEGVTDKGLFATQLSGPILVRNPHFRAHVENLIYKKCGIDKEAQNFEYELLAYNESLKGLCP